MTNPTCVAPECDRDVYIKKSGLCQSHYNRMHKYGDLDVSTELGDCEHCGLPVSRRGAYGPPPKYCSKSCQTKASYARRRDQVNAAQREATQARLSAISKTCPHCGAEFTPTKTVAQKFCSRACGTNFHRDRSTKQCNAEGCDRPLRARGMCSMHWRRWARAEGNEKTPAWDERRRANYQKRRALKLQLPADQIRPLDVYERDGWVCGICSEPVDRDLAWPDSRSPSLDHVTPLSLGGHHVMENVQLAHLECNVRKGNRIEADAMSA